MNFSIVVHGGAGPRSPDDSEEEARQGCLEAARVGYRILRQGGSALDAVEACVVALEDNPRFNAGTGTTVTSECTVELDAAIMDGRGLQAGAVGALPPFANPIRIARAVMERSPHVLLVAEGARRFAESQGFSACAAEQLITPKTRARYERERLARSGTSSHGGTVGAVARDKDGHVAAATSTGGMLFKLPGRVGDTPLIGAGTYADDRGGAASATGHGEAMIRTALTTQVCRRMREGATAQEAAEAAISELSFIRGTGGVIAVDRDGRVGLAFNTERMARASIANDLETAGYL
jgi:beta-aspartyl-peptidase (threonine type)